MNMILCFPLDAKRQGSTKERGGKKLEWKGEEHKANTKTMAFKGTVEMVSKTGEERQSGAAIAPSAPVEKDRDLNRDGPRDKTQDLKHSPARWLSLPGFWKTRQTDLQLPCLFSLVPWDPSKHLIQIHSLGKCPATVILL